MLFSVERGDSIETASRDADFVSMGINPSKQTLHEGHYLTMYQALQALHYRENAQGLFFVDDREFDFQRCSMKDENLFRSAPNRAAEMIRARMQSFIEEVSRALGDPGLGERIRIQRMSEYFAESLPNGERKGFRLYEYLLRHRSDILNLFSFDPQRDGMRSMIRPFCPCTYGPRTEETFQLDKTRIHSMCRNDDCNKNYYNVNVVRGDTNWCIHYTVDPLRDVFTASDNDARVLHVFGGDYGQPWGSGDIPKAQRLQSMVHAQHPDLAMDYYIGPLLTRDGEKLSKTRGDMSLPPPLEELETILRAKKPVYHVPASSTLTNVA